MTRKQFEKNLWKLEKEQLIKIILETYDGFDGVLSKKNKTGYLGNINGLGADPDML